MAETIKVKNSNGVVVEFPAGTPPEAIKAALGGRAAAPEPFNPLRMAGEAISSAAETTVDFVTGRKEKEPGVNELPASVLAARRDGKGMMLGSALDFARDDKARADIITKYFPNATWRQDQGGNYIFDIPQQDGTVVSGYGNRPGLSMQDVNEALAAGLIEAPLAMALRRFGPFGVGAGIGAGSVGTDMVAQSQGSEQPIDWTSAAMAFGLGTAGEMLPLDRIISHFSKRRYFTGDQLTDEGRRVLADLGIDPDTASREFVERMSRRMGGTMNPAEAANRATLESMPVPIPGTAGDVSRSKSQQLLEDAAEKGSLGTLAESQAVGIRARQQDALAENLDAIGNRIRGDNPPAGINEAGELVQSRLVGQRDASKASVDAAYDAARAAEAGIPSDRMGRLSANVRAAANEDSGLPVEEFAPNVVKMLDRLDNIGADGDYSRRLRDLQDWRRQVTALERAAFDSQDGYTVGPLRAAKKQFDQELADMAANDLIEGAPGAVKAWTDAIAENAAFKGTFSGKDIIGRLVETTSEGGKRVLKIPPEGASKLIFGATTSGLTSRPEMARALVTLRNQLGPDSPEWNALRQEAFGRFLQQSLGDYTGSVAQRDISGRKFATAWDKATTYAKPVLNALFSPEEMAMIDQFKRAALLVTSRERNTSNSATALVNITQKLLSLDVFGPRIMGVIAKVPGVGDVLGGVRYGVNQGLGNRPLPGFSGLLTNSAAGPAVEATATNE